jgi:hypothetical protein
LLTHPPLQAAFERQQEEIDALHRAQERAEARVSFIHSELKDSEQELVILGEWGMGHTCRQRREIREERDRALVHHDYNFQQYPLSIARHLTPSFIPHHSSPHLL